jgi:hypothetical protein
MGMMAFAVDLGYLVMVQSDLQSAADAAALAGSQPLMDSYVQYSQASQSAAQKAIILTQAKSNAASAAKQYANANSAGVASLALLDGDIEIGFTDGSGNFSTTSSNFPNTVRVTLRRDATANGSVGLFFGPVVGKPTSDLKAVAAATIYEANVSGFQNVANFKLSVLPMTYDVNSWTNFLATGMNPDGTALKDSTGNPEIQVYPSVKATGNFGLLGLDDSHAGASTVSSWIDNGMRQIDVASLVSNSMGGDTPLIPLSSHNSNILPSASIDGKGSWNWVGDTGLKTSVVHTLSNHLGQTYLMPLFKPYDDGSGVASSTNGNADGGVNGYEAGTGNGSHYNYNIVQFVAVKIISTDGSNVVVQPSAMVVDFSQVTFNTTPVPAGTSGTTSSSFTFTPPKLSQ